MLAAGGGEGFLSAGMFQLQRKSGRHSRKVNQNWKQTVNITQDHDRLAVSAGKAASSGLNSDHDFLGIREDMVRKRAGGSWWARGTWAFLLVNSRDGRSASLPNESSGVTTSPRQLST